MFAVIYDSDNLRSVCQQACSNTSNTSETTPETRGTPCDVFCFVWE